MKPLFLPRTVMILAALFLPLISATVATAAAGSAPPEELLTVKKLGALRAHVFNNKPVTIDGKHRGFFAAVAPKLYHLNDDQTDDLLSRMGTHLMGHKIKEAVEILDICIRWYLLNAHRVPKDDPHDLLSAITGASEYWDEDDFIGSLKNYLG